MKKIFFTFDFHILPEHRRISGRIFPCRCISTKTVIILWGRCYCWPIYLESKPSLNCWILVERAKVTFISRHIIANHNSYHDNSRHRENFSCFTGPKINFLPLSPSGWRGIVVTGRAGGCQTCGTHISVTTWRIFSIRSSMELSRPVVVHCHDYLPICPIWACPWAKNLSNLPQIGSRLCGKHFSETAGWIYPI